MNEETERLGRTAITMIVIGNLTPVVGVLFWGWSPGDILILYWLENLIVGLFALLRILSTPFGASGVSWIAAAATGAFFTVHYGVFCLVHGLFVGLIASGFGGSPEGDFLHVGRVIARALAEPNLKLALAGLALVQLALFLKSWVIARGWRDALPGTEMNRPYSRIVTLHFAILFGAMIIMVTGAPGASVVILCLVKIALEIRPMALKRLGLRTPGDA